jgi:hypothetical protein
LLQFIFYSNSFMKLSLSFFAFFMIIENVFSQSVFVPLNKDYYHIVDRYEIRNGNLPNAIHSSVKPYERKAIIEFIDSLQIDSSKLSKTDRFNLSYLQNDNWEWSNHANNDSRNPIFKKLYRKKSDFYHVKTEDFDLHVSPVVYFQGGYETAVPGIHPTINSRGIEVRGSINNKIGFYTFATDNQAVFPTYTRTYIDSNNAVPNEGFHKTFKKYGSDFFTARGYITFNLTKNIHFQFGHDKNFIGNGYRSLILSDFSSNYTFLKINTKVWKFNYMNLFAQMNAGQTGADVYYPQKYFAFHHLSLNITKHLNIGFFESIVFGNRDSTRRGTFDVNYLNPIIFYRSMEQHLGSPDNALLGMDYKLNFLKHFSFYGQFVLDEFYLQDLIKRNGSFRNKFAVQTGLKYIDVAGIRNLDLQLESNIVRPYTYQHFNSYTNYTNYNQALAHPMGANFNELIAILRYQPIGKLYLTGKIFYSKFGADTSAVNYGGNITKDYRIRARDFGNTIGQGVSNTLLFLSFTATYQIKHNLFIDFNQIIRQVKSPVAFLNTQTSISSVALRSNIPQRVQEY